MFVFVFVIVQVFVGNWDILIPLPDFNVILSCLLLDRLETDVFNEPIYLERLSNEVLRFIILLFSMVSLGIDIDDTDTWVANIL